MGVRKFKLADTVYSVKDPVRKYHQRLLTYTVTQICEECYEAISNDGEYVNIPFTEENLWERDVPVSGYDREGNYITTDDVSIEDFSIKYLPHDDLDWIDIDYRLQLGDRFMESCISEWSVDYEAIRHDLEHLIYHGSTEIRLHFEDSPTIIKLQRTFVQDYEKFKEFGTYHGWTYLMHIEIFPDEFVEKKFAPIFGYGRYVETLQALYEGLLDAMRAYPEVNEESPDKNRETMCEQLRSIKLEEYIRTCPYSEKNRMTDYYRTFINVNYHDRRDYLFPDHHIDFVQNIAEKAADIFIQKRLQDNTVNEAHEAATWSIFIELEKYRIKL